MLNWPHWFDKDNSLYQLCMQKVYEWHVHISKAAIDAIENMWVSDPKYEDPKKCKAYVEFALGLSLPFMYGKIEYIGVEHYKIMQCQGVCLVLAGHIVECALTIYSTGVKKMPGKSEGKFGQILDGAWKYCNTAVQSKQAQVSQHVLTTDTVDDTDMLDDHVLIAVSSDIEVESDGEA
ncbi:hypothetical protein HD554DRAFT_2038258 [Boletus coccyginus]|nr:hypothetical protein HD554DRAFT_2038258 [Boletus coccyginus]